jgi:hypothetical protein
MTIPYNSGGRAGRNVHRMHHVNRIDSSAVEDVRVTNGPGQHRAKGVDHGRTTHKPTIAVSARGLIP